MLDAAAPLKAVGKAPKHESKMVLWLMWLWWCRCGSCACVPCYKHAIFPSSQPCQHTCLHCWEKGGGGLPSWLELDVMCSLNDVNVVLDIDFQL